MINKITIEDFLKQKIVVGDQIDSKTETLPAIPNGWKWVQLKEIAEIVTKGTTPTTYGHRYAETGVPFLRAENITGGPIDYRLATLFISYETHAFLARSQTKSGDVLLTIAGTIGRSGYVPEDAPSLNMNQAVALIRLKRIASPRFISMMLQADDVQKQMRGYQVTAIISNLSLTRIKNLKLPLPSLDEQERIVARVEKITSRIDQVKKLREEALKDAEAIMQSALYRTFSSAEEKGWQSEKLGNVLTNIQSGFACGAKTKEKGFPHLRMNNINTYGKIDQSLLWRAPVERSKIEKYLLKKRDVIFNNTNSPELVGKTALFDIEKGDYVFSNHLTRLRVDESKLLPEWLVAYMRYLWQTKYFQNNCTRWINQAAFNRKKLVELGIYLPSLKKQEDIVNRLEKIQERAMQLKKDQEATREDLSRVTKIVLNNAFSGRL